MQGDTMHITRWLCAVALLTVASASPALAQPGNLIVKGSLCAGGDCDLLGEEFGFDTVRLKENNLRIKFQDTSASAGFPSQDWVIVANESHDGGRNLFAIGQPVALVEDPLFPSFTRPGEGALRCPLPGFPEPVEAATMFPVPPGTYFDAGDDCYKKLLTVEDGVVTISGDLIVEGNVVATGGGVAKRCPAGLAVVGFEADGRLICEDFKEQKKKK